MEKFPYIDHTLPIEKRVEDLVSRMTLEEKVSQILHNAPAIERLSVPQYNWWNECLHGVARAGVATMFPQTIGMAATWNKDLIYMVANAISDEARAKYHDAIRKDKRLQYYGLTFYSPNINIFRDPRWGRGQETYGEDPYLTSRMAVNFIRGLQGDDPKYLKVAACAKHYAVHSGPEKDRHYMDIKVSKKEMYETYLPAFKACVQEANVEIVMGAYNRVNGEAACASNNLLKEILREEWEFKGHVVSDCGAIQDIFKMHKLANHYSEAATLAINAGCDMFCVLAYTQSKWKRLRRSILRSVEEGLLTEDIINLAVKRLFTTRFKLGMFDPPELVLYTKIPIDIVDCEKHRKLALQTARESIVLLKNENNLLPLKKELKKIAVIGPNADNIDTLKGNYYGEASKYVTPLQGIKNKLSSGTEVLFAQGCDLVKMDYNGFSKAVDIAKQSDIIVMVLGLNNSFEGEEGETTTELANRGDRPYLHLPDIQISLLKEIDKIGKPIVLVLMSGSALAINYANEKIPAIIQAWYPGEEGGTAIADVIFGDYNPAGRLPITFYKSLDQIPDFKDYSMEDRTYRYMKEKPLYPFGYGLSYTKFRYNNLEIIPKKIKANENVQIKVNVENIGNYPGDEVVQLYISDTSASCRVPIRELKGFERIHLKIGEIKTVSFTLTPTHFSLVNEEGKSLVEAGEFAISVGGCQPGFSEDNKNIVFGNFEVIS